MGIHRPSPTPFSSFLTIILLPLHSSCLFPEQFFFFYFMSWALFQTISPKSLSGAFSQSLCLSLQPPPHLPHLHAPLAVVISNVVPSYFILTLPLITPSISLVHCFFSSSHLTHSLLCCVFTVYLLPIPQCHSFS